MESIPKGNLNEDKIPVTVYINRTDTVEVKSTSRGTPNFFRVGNGTMNKKRIQSINLLQEIANASKAAQYLLLAITNGIEYSNDYHYVVKVIPTTETQKRYLKQGYKELVQKDLVRRVKRSHYMVNPNALIPIEYEEAQTMWESIAPVEEEHTTRDS